jgi:uncharacterized iron-regulated protein
MGAMQTFAAGWKGCSGFLTLGLALLGCDGSGVTGDPGPGLQEPPAPAGYAGTFPTTGRPYRLLRGRGADKGRSLTASELDTDLADADAVCLGERHDNADDHEAQLAVLQRLISGAGQRRIALGMEMFQFSFQPVLDDYSAAVIDEATLLARTEWTRRWSYNFAYYRPLLERTVAAKGTVRGLNIRIELAQKIGRTGLASLTPDETAELPELDLTSSEHRSWFEATVGGVSAHGSSALLNLYAAQVARDETMADTAWLWLRSQEPAQAQIAIIAGNGHCMPLAVPARLGRRGARKVLTVKPVAETKREIDAALAEAYSDVVLVYAP